MVMMKEVREDCILKKEAMEQDRKVCHERLVTLDRQQNRAELYRMREIQRRHNRETEVGLQDLSTQINTLSNEERVLREKFRDTDLEERKREQGSLKAKMQALHRDMQKTLLQSELFQDSRMEDRKFQKTCD